MTPSPPLNPPFCPVCAITNKSKQASKHVPEKTSSYSSFGENTVQTKRWLRKTTATRQLIARQQIRIVVCTLAAASTVPDARTCGTHTRTSCHKSCTCLYFKLHLPLLDAFTTPCPLAGATRHVYLHQSTNTPCARACA